jgi:CPA1 family monovalent cation:H+ antiporter
MQKFWEFFAFVSNSVVFILMGLILSSIDIDFTQFLLPLSLTILVVVIARIISVYLPITIINKFKLEEHIPNSWSILLSW